MATTNDSRASTTTPHGCIYGIEIGCDVIFLVGQEHGEAWRLPAHTSILRTKNPLFEIMFSGRFSQQSTIEVPDVDGRAFDNLLRFLYEEPVSIQSVETALGTLYAGHKYECHGLVRLCIAYLLDNFKETNILLILKFIRLFSVEHQNNLENMRREREMNRIQESRQNQIGSENVDDNLRQRHINSSINLMPGVQPSAILSEPTPTADLHNLHYNSNTDIETECSQLLHQCLNYIDHHGRAVINTDEMEELDLSTLRLILSRDTLNVGNDEGIVFTALSKWADKECKRKQLPLTGASKRQLLDDSLFLPRYLTMNLKTFQNGPGRSDLFTTQEILLLEGIIKSGYCCPLPSTSSTTTKQPASTTNSVTSTTSILTLLELCSTSIAPYLTAISRPRAPRNDSGHTHSISSFPSSTNGRHDKCSSTSVYKKIQLRILRIRQFCCRLSSKDNTPCTSLNSSPVHQPNNIPDSQKGSSNASRSIVERIVVCLACILD